MPFTHSNADSLTLYAYTYSSSCYDKHNRNMSHSIPLQGKVLIANKQQNSDLFWGLRGAANNFGVVTRLTLQAHQMPETVYGGCCLHVTRVTHSCMCGSSCVVYCMCLQTAG